MNQTMQHELSNLNLTAGGPRGHSPSAACSNIANQTMPLFSNLTTLSGKQAGNNRSYSTIESVTETHHTTNQTPKTHHD